MIGRRDRIEVNTAWGEYKRMKRIPHLRWLILALIFLATVLCLLDRLVISNLFPIISKKEYFNLNKRALSYVMDGFLVAYAIGPSIMGWFVDRLGCRRGYVVSMGVWSAAGVLMAFALNIGTTMKHVLPIPLAPVVVGFMVCMFILGLGESANWPAAIKTISEWFPTRERSLAIGIFNSGSSIGAVVAPGLCAFLLLRYGWQSAFVVVGSMGFVWIMGWLAFYRPLGLHPRVTEEERSYIVSSQEPKAPDAKRVRWAELLRIPQVRGVVATRFFMDPIYWFYTFWLPTLLFQDRGLDIKKSVVCLTITFLASDFGNLFGGWASSVLVKRGRSVNAARKMVMTPCAVMMMLGIAVPFVPNVAAVTLIAIVMFCYQSWSVNMLTIPADVVPREIVASAAGLSHMGAGLGGIVVTNLVGYLVDKTGSFRSPIILMGVMPVIGITFLYLVIGRIMPYRRNAEGG